MTTTTMTASTAWLAQLTEAGMAHFLSQTPEVQVATLDMLDGMLDKLARMFVGVETPGTGHMPAWFMPEAEWVALGAPRTAEAWEAVLA